MMAPRAPISLRPSWRKLFVYAFPRAARCIRQLWGLVKERVREIADALDGYEG